MQICAAVGLLQLKAYSEKNGRQLIPELRFPFRQRFPKVFNDRQSVFNRWDWPFELTREDDGASLMAVVHKEFTDFVEMFTELGEKDGLWDGMSALADMNCPLVDEEDDRFAGTPEGGPSVDRLMLHIEDMAGRRVSCEVKQDQQLVRVLDLKRKLERVWGIPTESQRLWFQGSEKEAPLLNHKGLEACGLTNGSTLVLITESFEERVKEVVHRLTEPTTGEEVQYGRCYDDGEHQDDNDDFECTCDDCVGAAWGSDAIDEPYAFAKATGRHGNLNKHRTNGRSKKVASAARSTAHPLSIRRGSRSQKRRKSILS
jgi:hypothetical protein